MLTHVEPVRTPATRRPLRTIAVISRDPHQHAVEAVLGAVDHDIVFVESIDHAYSRIKRAAPDLVVMCLSSDDVEACQVLTMLALDRTTCRIPVVTHMSDPTEASGDETPGGDTAVAHTVPVSLN